MIITALPHRRAAPTRHERAVIDRFKPGRRTTIVPPNPIRMAAQRVSPTLSRKMKMARKVAKIGAENVSAATSASGVIDSA